MEEFEKPGQMKLVHLNGHRIVVAREGERIVAFQDHCTHRGGPLADGVLACNTVTCPWHGSRFCVADGRVKGGPATFSQPQLVVRESDRKVEVKLAHPLH